jgi:hypothetical protein
MAVKPGLDITVCGRLWAGQDNPDYRPLGPCGSSYAVPEWEAWNPFFISSGGWEDAGIVFSLFSNAIYLKCKADDRMYVWLAEKRLKSGGLEGRIEI